MIRNRATAAHPRNGAVNATRPTIVACFHSRRMTCGSSSAPARNVRITGPVSHQSPTAPPFDGVGQASSALRRFTEECHLQTPASYWSLRKRRTV